MRSPIVIADYDPHWLEHFELLRSRVGMTMAYYRDDDGLTIGMTDGLTIGMTGGLTNIRNRQKSLSFRNGEAVEESACLPATFLLAAESGSSLL